MNVVLYTRPKSAETHDQWPLSKTDSLGYRSIKEQVESFTIAGLNLSAQRAGLYDSDFYTDLKDESDMPIDPTRAKDFDFAMAHDRITEVRAKMVHDYNLKQYQNHQAYMASLRREQTPPAPPPPAPPPPAQV